MIHIIKKLMCTLLVAYFFMICGCSFQSNTRKVPEGQEITNSEEQTVVKENNSAEEQTNVQAEEDNKAEQSSMSSAELDTQILDKICVDCIFSLGIACRPSGYLRDFNLRFQAAPLDWMSSYSLDTAVHLFETKFSDFFAEIKEVSGKDSSSYRYVEDTKNNVTSIHHFKKGSPLEEEQKRFREMMLNRASKVDEILKNSSSIAFICDRSRASFKDLMSFLERFSKIYPDKKITLINIKNSNTQNIKKDILFESDTFKIIQFTFKDSPSSNDSSDAWKGNKKVWSSIIKSISLSGKFARSTTDGKVDF